MRQMKRLQELTIKDNFMFGAVMLDEENARLFLERALGFSISRVDVSREKSIVYHPEYKGIRLDIYANDEQNTHYNVEMQVRQERQLGKRTRYYHSQMDMELLGSGESYEELPDTYVIFICDYDPFGSKKYRYTFENMCLEESELKLVDGMHSVFLSTHGENEEEVPIELVKFLRYVRANLNESTEDFKDEYVKRLQESVQNIKKSREMGERYMILHEMLKDEREAGKQEGLQEGWKAGKQEGLQEGVRKGKSESILNILEDLGEVPENLRQQILTEKDPNILKKYLQQAVKAESVDQFIEAIS